MPLRFDVPPSRDITPESTYQNRRAFLRQMAVDTAKFAAVSAGVGGGLIGLLRSGPAPASTDADPNKSSPLNDLASTNASPTAAPDYFAAATGRTSTYYIGDDDRLNTYKEITTYNNYYEFGLDKDEPAKNAGSLITRPWTVTVDGAANKTGVYDIDKILSWFSLEERVYRFRCVEAWSMVIPWLGFPLADLLKRFEPTSKAKYVAFTTLHDEEQMPKTKRRVLDWPYREGLRMDEAMHPLAFMAVGLYGKELPKQNGAPIRLVVPWKYGFKNIKSIVKISFVESLPHATWFRAAPNEYGFYANVNPNVDHPRWSQRTERRIGEIQRRDTLPFNGYADQVASLYTGMDLTKMF